MLLDLRQTKAVNQLLLAISDPHGFPVYNQTYCMLQRYLRQRFSEFNNQVRKLSKFTELKSAAVLSQDSPNMKYYARKFPEELFKTRNPFDDTFHFMKPACCARAMEYWSHRRHLYPRQTVHQYSDCYRVQKPGQLRTLNRACYFSMADYHTLVKIDEVKAFYSELEACLERFYEALFRTPGLFRKRYVCYSHQYDSLIALGSEVQRPDSDNAPYFELKTEFVHQKTQVGTIQIDRTLPKAFGISQDYCCVHFSMGSLGRLMRMVLTVPSALPSLGVKVFLRSRPIEDLDFLKPLNLLVENQTQNLSESISGTQKQKFFYPYMIIHGTRQKESGKYTLLNRSIHTELSLSQEELRKYLNSIPVLRNGEVTLSDSVS